MLPQPAPPPTPPATLDLIDCLRVVTDDPAWVRKLLVGSLVFVAAMLILPLPLMLGYHLRVVRHALQGVRALPEWDDWGALFMDGLRVIGVMLPHQIGAMLLVGLPIGALALLGGVLGDQAGAAVVVLLIPLMLLAVPFMLAVAALMNVAQVRLAATDSFSAAFDLRANLGFLQRNWLNVLLAFLLLLGTNFVAQFGVFLCCVGLLPATLWSQICFHYALGRAGALGGAARV